jgi:hypothetical protein
MKRSFHALCLPNTLEDVCRELPVFTDDMLDHIFLKTLEGQRLRVWADIYETPLGEEEIVTGSDAYGYIVEDAVTTAIQESIKINGAHVILADVRADNGIVHIIDKVLVPQFMVL